MSKQVDLLPGTLDLLILKAVSLGPQHGYGVLLRIEQISGGALSIEQGALYPALYRLERRGLLKTAWGVSDTNRKAKFYQLTAAGVECLQEETAGWNRLVSAMRLGAEGRVCERVVMNFLRMLLAGIFRRAHVESEMDQEIRFHMESRAADLCVPACRRPMRERRARLEFGGIEKSQGTLP